MPEGDTDANLRPGTRIGTNIYTIGPKPPVPIGRNK